MWRFQPILKTTIWGGDEIKRYKKLDTELTSVGESWEVSDVEKSQSVVADGPDAGLNLRQLVKKYKAELVGNKNYKRFGDRFPLLVKFIDAHQDLSVQVHPDDEKAHEMGYKMGKTEMWYVVKAAPGAKLIAGLKRPVEEGEFRKMVETGDIAEVLKEHPVEVGDTFFIPAGRVHAIGAGCFICEIQQTSDVTFRLYDYHRKDAHGKERELHVEKGMIASNLQDTGGDKVPYMLSYGIPVNLVTSPFFCTNLLQAESTLLRDYSEWDTFVILIATRGKAKITSRDKTMVLEEGHALLIPAASPGITIEPDKDFKAIETYIK